MKARGWLEVIAEEIGGEVRELHPIGAFNYRPG